jgi:hypothetical protein
MKDSAALMSRGKVLALLDLIISGTWVTSWGSPGVNVTGHPRLSNLKYED